MFFSRCHQRGCRRGKWLKNEQLGGNQVVPVKKARSGTDEPNLGGRAFEVQSQAVLYKRPKAALAIALPLQLPVALDRGIMRQPVCFLIIGMGFAPLLPAVVDYTGVDRVDLDLAAMVFGATPALAIRLAAESLVRAVLRCFE